MGDSENKAVDTEDKKSGVFSRLKSGLVKTRNSLAGGIDNVVHGQAKVELEHLDELEEALILADVGIPTTNFILEALKTEVTQGRIRNKEDVLKNLKHLMVKILDENQGNAKNAAEKPHIVLVIGVNGSGKTTTIGKLSQKLKNEGKNILLGAGDTFRAAAIEQMLTWGRAGGCSLYPSKTRG